MSVSEDRSPAALRETGSIGTTAAHPSAESEVGGVDDGASTFVREIDWRRFVHDIKRFRGDMKLTLRQLSTKTGIDYSTIARIERSRGEKRCGAEIFFALAEVMGRRPQSYIIGRAVPVATAPSDRTEVMEPEVEARRSPPRILQAASKLLLLIDDRTLARTCLAQILSFEFPSFKVLSFASLNEGLAATRQAQLDLILLRWPSPIDGLGAMLDAIGGRSTAPVAVLSDVEDTLSILHSLELGAKGVLPDSVSVQIAIAALRLIMAGGVFVPPSALIGQAVDASTGTVARSNASRSLITPRQYSIIAALSAGESNATIAKGLNLRESTVKVHIRNIKQRLKVKSRIAIVQKSQEILRLQRR